MNLLYPLQSTLSSLCTFLNIFIYDIKIKYVQESLFKMIPVMLQNVVVLDSEILQDLKVFFWKFILELLKLLGHDLVIVNFLVEDQTLNSQSVLYHLFLLFVLLILELSQLRELVLDVLVKVESSRQNVGFWLLDFVQWPIHIHFRYLFESIGLFLFFPERKLVLRNVFL